MILKYNQTQIYYSVTGKGPTVVLLHGFLESSTMWESLKTQLIDRHTIITIDLPGHGNSGVISDIHGMELMAKVVREVLRKTKTEDFTLVGHSMGGYVALAYIEAYQANVEKLILLNSTTTEDSDERKKNRDRVVEVLSKNQKAFINMAVDSLFVENTRDLYNEDIQKMKKEASNFPLKGIKAAILGMKMRKDRTAILKEFNKAKYMLCGINDPLIPYDEASSLALVSDAQLISTTGGHMSTIENLDKIVKIFI